MCISSNSVNQAQDLMSVTKFEDFPNSLIPNKHREGCRLKFEVLRNWEIALSAFINYFHFNGLKILE